jgi:hypothetical protein
VDVVAGRDVLVELERGRGVPDLVDGDGMRVLRRGLHLEMHLGVGVDRHFLRVEVVVPHLDGPVESGLPGASGEGETCKHEERCDGLHGQTRTE